MIIDPLLLQMFGQFPRDVGNPNRSIVYDLEGLRNFLTYNEGQNDCYVSVYPTSGYIDKLFYDFDGYARALEDAKAVYKYLVKNKHVVVPVASGKKGIHIYVLLTPKYYPNAKELLTSASYRILMDTFGKDYTKTTADPHVIGDIRRITRIFNTRRPPHNSSWCVVLPPEFVDATWNDILNWQRIPHEFNMVKAPNKTLNDFAPVNLSKIAPMIYSANHSIEATIPNNNSNFLEGVIRPCLYKGIRIPNPQHHIRVAATIDLLRNWSPKQVADMYSQLHWVDWDYNTTIQQIHSCMGLKQCSCTRIKSYGSCLVHNFMECPIRTGEIVEVVAQHG